MPIGISQIRNSANEIILDQNYLTLEVVQEGNLIASGSYNSLVTLDYSGIANPMVFIQLVQNARYFFGPTSATRFWMSGNHTAGTPIPYKLCGFRPTLNPGGIGIRINRPGTEEIAFHSRKKYLRIIDCVQTVVPISNSIIRSGDGYSFGTAGDGTINFWQFDHNTRPQPFSTYWLATMTGLASRPGSNASTGLIIERKSTTRYELRVDGNAVISRDNRLAMGLPDPTGVAYYIPRLIAA